MAQPVPRLYRRHQRRAKFANFRYNNQGRAFLAKQATRLSSTVAVLFVKLRKYSARRIAAAANLAAIP